MCGIIGILSNESVATRVYQGLSRLEYRGYDSAGIATLNETGAIERKRAEGKLVNLKDKLENVNGIGWKPFPATYQFNQNIANVSTVPGSSP